MQDYQEYLKNIHEKLQTPDEVLLKVVEQGTGTGFVDKKRIIAGEVSEVYDLTLSNQQHAILRICISDYTSVYEKERWATIQCAKVGVPVPKILYIDDQEINGKHKYFSLMEKIEGDTLERGSIDFGSLSQEVRKDLIVQAGKLLSRIHSVKTSGFGHLSEKGVGQFKTSDEYIDETLGKRDDLEYIAKAANIPIEIMNQVFPIIEELKEYYRTVTPGLVHGDYACKHFMAQDNKIIGIIDWGEVRSDSPLYDFSNWDYWFGDEIPTSWLMEGYSDKQVFEGNYEELIKRFRVWKGFEVLRYYTGQEFADGINKAKTKLLLDLKYFDPSA